MDHSWPGRGGRGYGQEPAAPSSTQRPPALQVEVVVVAGDEGRWLAARQAAVIREALERFTTPEPGRRISGHLPRPNDLPDALGDGTKDVNLLAWLRRVADQQGQAATAGPMRVPVAWIGRTSTEDQQDPTLSLPRQLASARRVLPEEMVIVAHFYDAESGRKSVEQRGHGHGHDQLDVPIPRDDHPGAVGAGGTR